MTPGIHILAQFLQGDEPSMIEKGIMYLLPLVGCVMLAYAIFNLVLDLRKKEFKKVNERLKEQSGSMRESAAERAAKESILRRVHEDKTFFSMFVAKLGFVPALQQMLDQANIPWPATTVIINLIGLAAGGYITCYFMEAPLWLSIAVVVAAGFVPLLAIWIKRRIRINKFMNQLPDVFELMSQALRAGHSLANAIMLISHQLPDPVGTEFARVFHEQNLGIKIEDALLDMSKRVGLMDVRFFVTAVLIQRQTGGDLAEVLDNISGVIRDRIKLFGSVRALTAEGRLSGYVLLALPVCVFLLELVINPEYANVMLEDKVGQYMLIGAGVSQLLGLALIQKIVNIKV
jgi:tight adherence protein B